MPWNADVQRRRRTLGYIHLAGALPDVGRDDGGDDAAIGCPDDLDLFGVGQTTLRSGEAVRTDQSFCPWLSGRLDLLQLRCRDSTMGVARRRPSFIRNANDEPNPRRNAHLFGRSVSVHTVETALSRVVSLAAGVPSHRMARRQGGRDLDGNQARNFLHRLLLGVDGAAVCRGRNESRLDRTAFAAGARREASAQTLAFGAGSGWPTAGLGRMDFDGVGAS
jgi:hypothetical protein